MVSKFINLAMDMHVGRVEFLFVKVQAYPWPMSYSYNPEKLILDICTSLNEAYILFYAHRKRVIDCKPEPKGTTGIS